MNNKTYLIAWQCQKIGPNDLDCLAIQGPHTRDTAEKLKAELHKQGYLASVIFCGSMLKLNKKDDLK